MAKPARILYRCPVCSRSGPARVFHAAEITGVALEALECEAVRGGGAHRMLDLDGNPAPGSRGGFVWSRRRPYDEERAWLVRVVRGVGDRLAADLAEDVLAEPLSDGAFDRLSQAYIEEARDALSEREHLVALLNDRRWYQ
jgi:hypothetical protein